MAAAAPATAMTMPATLPIMVAAALVLELAVAAVVALVREPDVCEGPASVAEASSLLLGLEADVSSEPEDSWDWDGLALVAVVLGLRRVAVRQYESTCCWTEGARMSLGQLL
jgi:predicted neutral ceramidase superfamily lipid hydrolase